MKIFKLIFVNRVFQDKEIKNVRVSELKVYLCVHVCACMFYLCIFLKRFYLFILRKREGEGEREGEKHQCVLASRVAPTRDLAYNPGMCPDWELNP